MVFTGYGSYIYWGREGTALAGAPATDQNIPFNPMTDFGNPKPVYEETTEYTFDSLDPKYTWTSGLKPGEGGLPMSFRDPFLLLAFFTHKTVTAAGWGTGTGTITGDFTQTDHVDTLFCQYHLHDATGAGHVDRLHKGGLPMKYEWIVEPGKLLQEVVTVKWLNTGTSTQIMSCSNNFHDQAFGSNIGGWAAWDNTGLGATGKRSVVDMSLTWNNVALPGIDIKTIHLTIEAGSASEQLANSYTHSVYWHTPRKFTCLVEGELKTFAQLVQSETRYESKTKADFILYYDVTTNYEKYLKCTQVVVNSGAVESIPKSGEAAKFSVTFEGKDACAITFSGKYKDRPSPHALITHDDA